MANIIEIIRNFFLQRLQQKRKIRKRSKSTHRRLVHRIERVKLKARRPIVQKIQKVKIPERPEVKKLEHLLKTEAKILKEIQPKHKPFKFPRFNIPKIGKLKMPKFSLPKKPPQKAEKTKKQKSFKISLPRIKLHLPKLLKFREKPAQKLSKEKHVTGVIVADVMNKNVYTARPGDTLNYVVRVFADKKISGVPVVKDDRLVGVISESDIVKFIENKELLSDKNLGLRTLSEIKVEELMHKSPVFVYEYTNLSDAIDSMNKYDITRLPVLNERRELIGIMTRSDVMRSISKKLLFKLLEKPEAERIMKVETDIDEILQIVERKGSISLGEIKKKLMLPEDKIEEWGKILERHNLIEMFYPPIGKPEFRKKIK